MKPGLRAICFSAIFAIAMCTLWRQPTVYSKLLTPELFDDEHYLGPAVRHKNLTVRPIFSIAPSRDGSDYLTLDEAFDRKKITISELENDSVNTLTATNLADGPIFVMSGEVILGGKQDRIVAKDMLIPAKSTVQLDVFCVEHGRWSEEGGSNRSFRTAKKMAHTDLRASSKYSSQGAVWEKVGRKNTARKTENSTDTFRAVADDKQTKKAVDEYIAVLGASLARHPRAVGFIASYGDDLSTVEIFSSPALFAKIRGKLIESVALEAVDAPEAKNSNEPTAGGVAAFLKESEAAPATTAVDNAAAVSEQKIGDVTGSTTVKSKTSAKPVYKSTQKK
ncbi:MAG: hypothetical protein IPL79_18225 [Myxococcales bacterium]|nr:hypothetical protein [Myxococcales bacterium]